MRFRIYRYSPLATFFSFAGAVLIVVGLPLLFAGVVPGVICIGIGIGASLLAEPTANRKAIKKWIKELNRKGALDELRTSVELAFELYHAKPHKLTLKYIAKLNPQAAIKIKQKLVEEKQRPKNTPQKYN